MYFICKGFVRGGVFDGYTDSGAKDAMFSGGKSGASFAGWHYPYAISDFQTNVPEGEVEPYNAPLDAEGNYNIMFPGAAGPFVMINKDYEHPEALFKVINATFDMGKEFDKEAAALYEPNKSNNVDWLYIYPTSGFNLERANVVPDAGALAKAWVETNSDGDAGEYATGQDRSAAQSARAYSLGNITSPMNWIDYHARYIASNKMTTPEIVVGHPEFYLTTESMADLKPNLDTLEQQAFLKIILGEEPIDYFDTFVEEWYAQGGQTMTDEVRALSK